jgi:hypothetical protein
VITVRYADKRPIKDGTDGAKGKDGKAGATGVAGADGADLILLPPSYQSVGGAFEIDLSLSHQWRIELTGDATFTVVGYEDGMKFSVSLTQDSFGAHTVTWFSPIRWSRGGTPPTLTPAAGQRDTFGFETWVDAGVPSYDGFVIGQDI